MRALKNFRAEQPYQHAVYYTAVLTSEQMWTKEELLEATDGMLNNKKIVQVYVDNMGYYDMWWFGYLAFPDYHQGMI